MVKLYRVGGCVRDQLMGRKSKDIDYAVEASSYEAMRGYIETNGSIYVETPEFLTIRARVDGVNADFVLCRKDGVYFDGRRPESVTPGTLLDDLSRRDFTMNAMALTETDGLIDPFGGQADIQASLIRCVGEAEQRFQEDYLRILRALRFSVTLGFSLHTKIRTCLRDEGLTAMLARVSVDRTREELHKMLAWDCSKALRLLMVEYSHIGSTIFENTPVWLKPTTEQP